jgi:3-isopropylmalate dehydrogenase
LSYQIGVLAGDDIGLEIVPATVQVLKASLKQVGCDEVKWVPLPIGYPSYLENGETFPSKTIDTLKTLEGWILGPIGHSNYPKDDPKAINPHPIIRKSFDLHSNIRPAISYQSIPSIHNNVDIIVVRENNEGFQPDRNVFAGTGEFMPTPDLAMSVRIITRRNSEAVAETAFQLAKTRMKKVTAVHKASVFKLGCGLFLESCRKIAENYPEVIYEELNVDASAAALVMKPQDFDVVVTTNMFGDILSDLTAGLVGGLGMAPGLCVGPKYAMAQATHGSAPDIAGKNIANPYAMMMSGKMLLEWLALKNNDTQLYNATKLLEKAIKKAIAEKAVTKDIGGTLTTTEMTQKICTFLKEESDA